MRTVTTRSYLDHASTSPLRPEAREALLGALDIAGDPGRIHAEGLTAREAVEQARRQVADFLGAFDLEALREHGVTNVQTLEPALHLVGSDPLSSDGRWLQRRGRLA